MKGKYIHEVKQMFTSLKVIEKAGSDSKEYTYTRERS